MAERSTTSACLCSVIFLSTLSLGAEAQIVLQLDRVPETGALCPGDHLLLRCNHNDTFNEPQWRVINVTQVIYRGITFRGSTLEAHSLIENTRTLEVLEIDEVQPNFHNLRYSCFYDTNGGERKSNEITVEIHELPSVEELTVQVISSTTANISWKQDKDMCNQTITPLLLINSSEGVPTDCKLTELNNFECLVSNLTPDTQYTVDVCITTEDGRRNATAASMSFKTAPRLGGPHTPSGSGEEESLCFREPLACGLYGVSGFFGLAILVIVISSALSCSINFIRHGRNQGKEDFSHN